VNKTKSYLLFLLLLSNTLACASTPIGKTVEWPDPPEKPRIRFVTAFRTGDDLDTSGWAHFRRSLFGNSSVTMGQPMGVAVSEDGQRVYVADYGLNQVVVADLANHSMRVFAPYEGLLRPFNVALGPGEQVYVSDSAAKAVVVFDRNGKRIASFGRDDFERPTGLAVDHDRGIVYVVDSASHGSSKHRVLAYDLLGKKLHELGPKEGPGGRGNGDGQFYFPSYVSVDKEGMVYVADTMNFRIQVFGPDGKFVRKFGESGDGPGTFQRLKGLAFDSFGNIYAVDGGHANVQIFSKDFRVLMFFGGSAPKLEYFDVPSGIAIDPRTNRIYVCNEYLARVNVYELVNTTASDSLLPPEAAEKKPDPATENKPASPAASP
jgi:DNA-binding beta-propeller fold protein YncE